MIKPTKQLFKNLKSEGLKRVVEILNNNDKITNKHFNVVDAVEYTHEYFNKGSEQDEQININNGSRLAVSGGIEAQKPSFLLMLNRITKDEYRN